VIKSAATVDKVREGTVLFLGRIACHLPDLERASGTRQLLDIVEHLLKALSTPSYSVQRGVCDSFKQLFKFKAVRQEADRVFNILLAQLEEGESYGDRKGAAFGLADAVAGLSIHALRDYDLVARLSGLAEMKSNAKARQGALMAFQQLFETLGSKFEPYVVRVLPHLLRLMGDDHVDVREVCREASRVVMSALSAHGIKMVLPQVLGDNGLNNTKWRTKVEAINILGLMAFCAPRQLACACRRLCRDCSTRRRIRMPRCRRVPRRRWSTLAR
jgi:hypothetical protein